MEVLIAACGAAVATSVGNLVLWILNNRKKKESGIRAGIRVLLYDRIKNLCAKHIGAGFITTDDLSDLMTMHTIYHNDLGGNGYLDTLMDAVKGLPKRP